MTYLGVIFAFVALLGWAFGDFFIQRTSRKTGVIDALFYICIAATVVLLPFVWKDLQHLTFGDWRFLVFTGLVGLVVYTLEFYVFEIGKLSVVEPIIALELPFTVLIAGVLGHERFSVLTYVLMTMVFIGISLTLSRHHSTLKGYFQHLEKGALLALVAAAGVALDNFLTGQSSQRISNPLLAIWVIHTTIAACCFIYLLWTRKLRAMISNISKTPWMVIAETITDNVAWIAFAVSVIYIPISVTITLSEGYIILAVVLGVVINKEKLKHHQLLGVILAIGGVLLLSMLSIWS